jgi:hypothetical protein
MIDHIWRERLGLADLLMSVGPQQHRAFALAGALERARRAAMASLRRLRDLLRRS